MIRSIDRSWGVLFPAMAFRIGYLSISKVMRERKEGIKEMSIKY